MRGSLSVGGVEAGPAWNVSLEVNGTRRNRAKATAFLLDQKPGNKSLHDLGWVFSFFFSFYGNLFFLSF